MPNRGAWGASNCTLLTEWAYSRACGRSHWFTRALDAYLHDDNVARRHSALKNLPVDNALRNYR